MNYETAWKQLYELISKKKEYCNELTTYNEDTNVYVETIIKELNNILKLMETMEK